MMGPPPGMGHPGMMGPPPGMAQPMGRPGTDQVRPLQAPPYLASQTAARMDAPIEPWAGSLKILMMVFGFLLILCYVMPHRVTGETVFSWTNIGKQPNSVRIMTSMILGTGFLAAVAALLPLVTLGRGIGAAFLGLSPVVYGLVGRGKVAEWHEFVLILGILTLIPGLLVRAQYRSSIAGRLMTTIGVLCVLAVHLIPINDVVLIKGLFTQVGDAEGRFKIGAIVNLLPFFLAIVSLLVWLPSTTSAGGTVLAWIWIMLTAVTLWTMWAIGSDPVEDLKAKMHVVLWLPIAMTAWNVFVGYGVATVVGKQLEHA